MCSHVFASCAALETEPTEYDSSLIPPDGKYDTAYYSNLAMELEGDFVSSLAINVTELDEQARQRLMDPGVLRVMAEQQVKMAKGQLNDKHQHLNLTVGDDHLFLLSTDEYYDAQTPIQPTGRHRKLRRRS